MKFEKFTILDYEEYYKCVKVCSITGKQYQVKLTNDEYIHYYKPGGKDVKHLTNHSNEEKLFLETTCTPEEVKSLSNNDKKLSKRRWRFQLGHKDKLILIGNGLILE